MKVASKYPGQALMFSVASKKDFLSELEEDFGLGMSDGGELPVITIRTKTGHKYTMREEFTYVHGPAGTGDLTGAGPTDDLVCFRRDGRSLERFVDDYLAGRLKPYVKSEPVPERNADAVKVTPELGSRTWWPVQSSLACLYLTGVV